ncbi:histidine phosphatase family protein [Alteribacillus iranensis]|uniref:Alpha-ribazole phosphatase n=1 Tax=Alteribacillus iranensis TaxID=930128 RepID=A0A1I1ZMS3_9BACI|nr:histidine phosphatase family protein [Alteribacillus iranensis]SFE33114.1 alpha-ribazole phosphatase [Alteribacillus iranensis]
MDEQRTVLFIRHGITAPNKSKKYTGWSDPELLEEEKERLLQYTTPYQPDAVFSSDLLRARQTAALYFPAVDIVESRYLREFHFGVFEGKTYEELKNNRSYCQWLNHWTESGPPEGESFDEFRMRVSKGWDMMKQQSSRIMAVVTHSGWIREWCHLYAPGIVPEQTLWNIPFGGGWIGTFTRRKGDWTCNSLQEVRITEKRNG